jgi:hypothetical protein
MEVVFSEGTRGLRNSWAGQYYEELAIDQKAIRMDRLSSGAPVLMNHASHDIDNVIGVVEGAYIQDGKAIAKIRFTKSEKFSEVISRIKEGILRKISVGYFVHRYDVIEEAGKEKIPVYRATDWEPAEISFVCVPFDDKAQVRDIESREGDGFSLCEFPLGEKMEKRSDEVTPEPTPVVPAVEETPARVETPKEEPAPAPEPATEEPVTPVEPPAAASAQDIVAERNRVCSILEMARNAKLGDNEVRAFVDNGLSVEAAGAEIKKLWASRGQGVILDTRISVGEDLKSGLFERGISNALLHRIDAGKNQLTDEGKQFRGMRVVDMVREMMGALNVSTRGMSPTQLSKKALSRDFWLSHRDHGTTDFPNILADVMNKTLRQAYEAAPQTWRPFCRVVSAVDYKSMKRNQLGEAPALAEVGEHGEVTYGTIGEMKEEYAVKRYGKQFAISHVALVNDDLNAFARLPQLFGYAGANLESDLVYGIFNTNAAMADTIALFHASHGNLGTTGAISDTTLAEMREKGRKQTGIDGLTYLNIMHKFLVVPASKEVAALKAVTAVVPNATSGVNVFASQFQVIAEPRLDGGSATAWYGVADPSSIDTIEVAFLDGQQGVQLDSEIDFDTDGMKMKCTHDVGVKAIDWRGMFKNSGA